MSQAEEPKPKPLAGASEDAPRALATSRAMRGLYFAAGLVLTGIGIIGAFLPLLPTTIFLILAAWCFGHSSPRFEAWLLDHPRFGPTLRAWRQSGAISRPAKRMAWTGMAFGYAVFLLTAGATLWLAVLVAAIMMGCAIYVGTRPEV
jgi:uncharacterized protein